MSGSRTTVEHDVLITTGLRVQEYGIGVRGLLCYGPQPMRILSGYHLALLRHYSDRC